MDAPPADQTQVFHRSIYCQQDLLLTSVGRVVFGGSDLHILGVFYSVFRLTTFLSGNTIRRIRSLLDWLEGALNENARHFEWRDVSGPRGLAASRSFWQHPTESFSPRQPAWKT